MSKQDYNLRKSVWLSVDPLAEKYPNRSPYEYTASNPVKYDDPDGRDWRDRIAGAVIGIITNVIPGSTSLRNTYTPNDASDYNNTLRAIDNTATVVGAAAIVGGGGAAAAGEAALATGGAVAISGVGAAPGGVIAAGGATVTGTGLAIAAGGVVVVANAEINKNAGYNYGDNSSSGGGGNSRTSGDPLRTDKNGRKIPDDEAAGTRDTQLGTKQGRKGKYRQGREFNERNQEVRDIDFTDHGRPQNHTNPHQHKYSGDGAGSRQRGSSEKLD